METLKYKDETDRSYGATGMAIGLLIFDGEDMLASINIDGDPNDMVVMSPDFYFAGNPGVSAKTAWNQMLKNYNLGIGMLMSNLLCRHLVSAHQALPAAMRERLHSIAVEEGRDACSLEDDEIDRLFEKNMSYLTKVFSHRGVQSIAHDFAAELLSRRTLSRLDVLEQLEALRVL
ncbi:hypothetical protein EEL34_05040 [Muribaculaceae bacterium Isolate-039 (Harlan)]|jgi:hypothetical protein|uniref:hypothetical protein n=1 Tax=Duncaniella muris TaxID=2094150 RepID=UPI000F498098|nr:hypothetical protein [Duncaniella muris]NBH93266.1 hypothetical protein [Muribaculaceae bacterium S4]NBI21557.1 hypothetical protein [Muribaculaceae bacterium Z1]ROS90624.1 hypothetical protein EEL34_05040 [Muribaculaceae bacterium Isolate-039 (Harlan)]ROS95577.1 hypothetical protein EEL37_10390 [Muribaculaceae bacterium Isolate-077 (Janvier)]ROS96310.1 hypothetical protein EEL40_08990 [Muribaculaceae bacterium Isolate-083 (Janvier)]ROS98922.1 hypothetical protein EEL41_10490 [Muribaculace